MHRRRKIVLYSNLMLTTTEEKIVEFDPYLMATLATREESRPPDRSTPKGASDISRFTTALMKLCCSKHSAVKSLPVIYKLRKRVMHNSRSELLQDVKSQGQLASKPSAYIRGCMFVLCLLTCAMAARTDTLESDSMHALCYNSMARARRC